MFSGDIGENLVSDLMKKNLSSAIGNHSMMATNDSTLNDLANLDATNDHDFDNFDHKFIPDCLQGNCETGGSICKRILWEPLSAGSNVRTWDLLILIPNVVFLFIIAAGSRKARLKLRATHSPIFGAFYSLVVTNTAVSIIRCLISMALSTYQTASDGSDVATNADKLLWIILRFFLLATEMSVIVFAVASGHLDSKNSIRRVVLISACISLAFSITQCVLEFHNELDITFSVEQGRLKLFGHGGSLFWMISSLIFALLYLAVVLLPLLPCKKFLSLPNKRSFYYYVGFMTVLNSLQWAGSLELVCGAPSGLCFVNFTTFLYFTAFTPIVYFTFLQPFFKTNEETPSFLYKAQLDEFEEEMVNNAALQGNGGTNPIIINGYRRLDIERKLDEDATPLATSSSAFPGET